MKDGDYVVLLHGIFRTKSSMASLERHLSGKGYDVINVDYPSCKKPIEGLVDDVRKSLLENKMDVSKKIHFVGYSMGGMIVRGYIKKYRPENIGRVVMLGTPNQGSEVADFIAGNFLYKRFYGPAGQQLGTDQSKFRELYGAVDYELGIIAGNFSIDPISSFFIPGDNDGKVSVERTKLEGMKDHIVISATHTFMPDNKKVKQQVAHFIEHGMFLHG